MSIVESILPLVIAVALAPMVQSVITCTKAAVAGRVGAPMLQPYRDILKLIRKGAVYSGTTTAIFRMGPLIGLASLLCATALIPFGGFPALTAFPGDLVMFAYLMALSRFFTVLAALDTGSSFEGMGASREVTFSALAEPAFFLALAALAQETGRISLSPMLASVSAVSWIHAAPMLTLALASLIVVFLAENARIPVDDPTTHLELTMIHEVMVLDHSGPDLAMIEYGAALKLWLFGTIIVGVAIPFHFGNRWIDAGAALAGMLALGIGTGVVESSMARLRLVRVPQLLLAAIVLAALAFSLAMHGRL